MRPQINRTKRKLSSLDFVPADNTDRAPTIEEVRIVTKDFAGHGVISKDVDWTGFGAGKRIPLDDLRTFDFAPTVNIERLFLDFDLFGDIL